MRVAFVVYNSSNKYSGGRIHALTLAYAFASLGYDVDYYTNNIPVFVQDLPAGEAKQRIYFQINKFFLFKAKHNIYQHIILVPHLASRKSPVFDLLLFYPFALRMKNRGSCKLWFIDFESPNWIHEVDPSLRSMSAYKYSNKIIKHVDIILSTTNIGRDYARKYYIKLNPNIHFSQLYLAINSIVCNDISLYSKREDRVVFFGRFGQKHKNSEALDSIIGALPRRFELAIVGKESAISDAFKEQLKKIAINNQVRMRFYSNITDKEKFDLLASAKLLVFSSKFEGYGLPPIEAQYMGTPVICSDLPVLREVSPLAKFINFEDKIQLKNAVNDILNAPPLAMSLRDSVSKICTYESFTNSLKYILDKL